MVWDKAAILRTLKKLHKQGVDLSYNRAGVGGSSRWFRRRRITSGRIARPSKRRESGMTRSSAGRAGPRRRSSR